MKNKTVITINGRRYDASGGSLRPLDPVASTETITRPAVESRASSVTPPPHSTPAAKHQLERHVAHHARPLNHSATYARKSVTKPSKLETAGSHPVIIGHDRDNDLAKRAAKVKTSPMLQRFSYPIMPVTPAPAAVKPTAAASAKDLFVDRQLMLATAHSQHVTKHKTNRRVKVRRAAMAVAICAGLAAVGFFWYGHNATAVSLRVASTKAGFIVQVPHYTPAGFGLSRQIAAGTDRVVLTYQSRSDDRRFLLEQSPSTWTSEALRQSVEADNQRYQTLKVNGLDIYITGENNASWVDHGKLFTVRGGLDLSNNQIADIANSL